MFISSTYRYFLSPFLDALGANYNTFAAIAHPDLLV